MFITYAFYVTTAGFISATIALNLFFSLKLFAIGAACAAAQSLKHIDHCSFPF